MPDDQLSLFGSDAPPPPSAKKRPKKPADFTLFLALMPDARVAQRLFEAGEALCRLHGVRGYAVPQHRLHLSLLTVEEYETPLRREQLMARCESVAVAMGTLRLASLPICFDSVMSLGRSDETRKMPFALCMDVATAGGVQDLGGSLSAALLGKRRRPSAPHISLRWDRTWVGRQPIEALHWTARELRLILSHVGDTEYETLGRWELGA